jgi:hypothetical protein
MNKIMEAWAMVKLSGRVLRKNPFLLGYLLCSLLALAVLFGGAAAPMAKNFGGDTEQLLEPYATFAVNPAKTVVTGPATRTVHKGLKPNWGPLAAAGLLVYFPGSFVMVFFNVAFLASVKRILNGKEASFRGGLALAWEKRGAVLMWSLFMATVGVIIAVVKNKLDNWQARRLLGLAELGWKLAIFLAVPVLAAEGLGPMATVRRSAELFRKTWGQTLAGDVGIGALQLLVWLAAGVIPGVSLFYLGMRSPSVNYALVGAGLGWMPVCLIVIGLIGEAMGQVFRMVLYVFAVEGVVPEEYREQDCSWFVGQRA